jgi:hypothetical protein
MDALLGEIRHVTHHVLSEEPTGTKEFFGRNKTKERRRAYKRSVANHKQLNKPTKR